MKNKFLLPLLAVIAVGFSACTKNVEKLLPGEWTVTEYRYIYNGDLEESTNLEGTATFNSDGTGEFRLDDGGQPWNPTFFWAVDEENENITLNGDVYKIVTNKPKEQMWEESLLDGEAKNRITLKK